MLTPFDHVLFAVLAVLGPVWGATMGYRRLARCAPGDEPGVRRSVYRSAILMQWSLSVATVVFWAFSRRPWWQLGLVPQPTWGFGGALVGTAIVIAYVARRRRDVLVDDEALEEVRERMRHIEPMLPRTPAEMRAFGALSVTAGICEELLYRGFMIFYLSHFTSLIFAAAIAAVVFGIGHAYQGRRGVALTGMVGAFLGAVYLVSGSLFASMLLHALMDLHSGHLAYRALRRSAERDAEWAREHAAELAAEREAALARERETELARERELALATEHEATPATARDTALDDGSSQAADADAVK